MGLFNLFKPAGSAIVIDGMSLNESLGMKGKVAPKNQLQLLRRLSRFAQREKLNITIVLTGSPLHKAPAKKKFEGMMVYYSKSPQNHAQVVVKTARALGGGTLLISDNAAVAKAAGRGLATMRMSTFRKAFDASGSDSDAPERSSGGNSGGNRRNRGPRRRPQKPAAEKGAENKVKNNSDADAINELIDLID